MKNWELKEKHDAKMLGGTRVRGSGNQWDKGGDVSSESFLCESKYTSKKSYTLTKTLLDKIYTEALMAYKIPLFSIQIQDREVVLVMKDDFEKMLAAWTKSQEPVADSSQL